MFKTTLASLTLSAALASPASAQFECGSVADVALRSGMYQRQIAESRAAFFYETGHDGLAPSGFTTGSLYVPVGGGVLPYDYIRELQISRSLNSSPLHLAPYPNAGFYGVPRQYNYNNIGWGVNAGIGGSFGNFGGGGFNNIGWGLGIGVGGNSGSFGW